MTDSSLKKFTSASGIAAVVFYAVAATLMSDAPGIESADQMVLDWVRAHRGDLLAASYAFGLSVSATFLFVTGLWGVLKDSRDKSGVFRMIGLAGGYSIFTLALAGFVFALGAAYRVETLPAAQIKLLNDLSFLSIALTGFPTAVSMVGFAVAMAGTSRFPRWLHAFSAVIVLAHLTSAGAFAASGWLSPSGIGVYVAPVLYYVWILVVSVSLLRGPAPAVRTR